MARKDGPVTLSIINMKGGVGKSTIAALLCRHASLRLKLDVLAIDLDPQANLSQAVMGAAYNKFLYQPAEWLTHVRPSWPALCRPSTAYRPAEKAVDAWDKPRHDESIFPLVGITWRITLHAIQAAEAAALCALGLMTPLQPPLTRPSGLGAIRYRAFLRRWAF